MKKNKIISFLFICMVSVVLVGCTKKQEVQENAMETEEKNMFGLTQTEQKMYAEYAAGVLMKYNAGTNLRVMEGQKLVLAEKEEQEAREKAEKREQLAAEYQENKGNRSEKNENQSKEENTAGTLEKQEYSNDMASSVGMDNFSITYAGYEVQKSYPDGEDDIYFAMSAAEGKDLLVVKFDVINTGTQTQILDMFSKQGKFRLKLNGKIYKSQYTLLPDDLSMYKGEVEAGESLKLVLIFEIPENLETMATMELMVTLGERSAAMLIND